MELAQVLLLLVLMLALKASCLKMVLTQTFVCRSRSCRYWFQSGLRKPIGRLRLFSSTPHHLCILLYAIHSL